MFHVGNRSVVHFKSRQTDVWHGPFLVWGGTTCQTRSGDNGDLTDNWDFSVNEIAWAPDGKTINFIAHKGGVTPVFTIDVASHEVKEIASGICDYAGLMVAKDGTVYSRQHAMTYPNEIVRIANGEVKRLTNVNTELLASLKMPTVKKEMVPTTDGKEMLVWTLYPADFDSAKAEMDRLAA